MLLLLALLPQAAHAWWNKDWSFRKKVVIDAQAGQVPIAGGVASVPVAVRLSLGNFSFVDAREDGADLRFVAADDKTPLSFHVEKFDGVNEIAIVWVQVPAVGTARQEFYLYYGNANATPAANAAATYDSTTAMVLHFGEREPLPRDQTAYANHVRESTAGQGAGGVIDAAASFEPAAAMKVAGSPSLRWSAEKGFTFSAWLRIPAAQKGLVFSQRDASGGIALLLDGDALVARVTGADGKPQLTPGTAKLAPGTWHHVALTASSQVIVYVDGKPVSQLPVALPPVAGDVILGAAGGEPGFTGELDEVQLAATARPADWLVLAANQHADTRLLGFEADEESGSGSAYLAVLKALANAVSLDGWIIIGLIGVLGFVSGETMITKMLTLRRNERASATFLERFRGGGVDVTGAKDASPEGFADSSLYRIYQSAMESLRTLAARRAGAGAALSAQELQVLRSGMDMTMVQEANLLNRRVVLLTLAISGAPFLGLLGTVVGIMITFGTIALLGDVNVNTIAPGVAAALSTTVAGLIIAIPAMFGYNQIMTRIRELSSSMEVFADDLISRIALSQGD